MKLYDVFKCEIFIFCRKYGMNVKINIGRLSWIVGYLLYLTATETEYVRHKTKVSVIALVRCRGVKLFKNP